ncbi:MAG: uridylate kinase [Methanomicrobiales archaeon]|nr:uridylate kinase [Methanomicrobiales archaeon]
MAGRHGERFGIRSGLEGETLVRKSLMKKTARRGETLRLLPELNVVKIGGHAAVDYGKKVMIPLLDEIGEISKKHQILVVTGGGGRVRHLMEIGIDLGMPTGVLAELSSKISEQNAIMVSILLSKYNGVRIHTGDLLNLPSMLKLGILPVVHGTPPYGLYEHPPRVGSIPPHRTDTGAFLMAEVLGARSCIIGKNVDGLYTEDPVKNSEAEFIPEITAGELMEMDLEDMVVERMTVELLRNAVNIREIRIVNCHVPGNIGRAISGEKIGTVIRAG